MTDIRYLHKLIRTRSRRADTAQLIHALEYGDEMRMLADFRNDEENLQALNMSIACMIDILIERDPQLDEDIERWCQTGTDGRTMARFVLDTMKARG